MTHQQLTYLYQTTPYLICESNCNCSDSKSYGVVERFSTPEILSAAYKAWSSCGCWCVTLSYISFWEFSFNDAIPASISTNAFLLSVLEANWYQGLCVCASRTRHAKLLVRRFSHVSLFIISCRQHNKANHCRVKTRQEQGRTKYYLVDTLVFNSLWELIEFYKVHKLRSHSFELSLKEPVPKTMSPHGKE